MTQCEDLDTLAVPNVCHRLADQHALWTKVFSKIKPPLTCPFRKVKSDLIKLQIF